MNLIARIKNEVFDKDGKLIYRKEGEMKTFLKNWIIATNCFYSLSNTPAVIDTAGNSFNLNKSYAVNWVGSVGDTTWGIVVGTSNQAVAIADNTLITKILEGTTSGKMTHAVTTLGSVIVSGSTAYFLLGRNFYNGSPASITIEEVGIIVKDTGQSRLFLVARDVTGGIAVAQLQTFVATYTFGTTV